MRSYKFFVFFLFVYLFFKEINRGMDIVIRMIKVVIKDLEREKEFLIKGDKNLNESIFVMKEIIKKFKRDIFLFFIDIFIKFLI